MKMWEMSPESPGQLDSTGLPGPERKRSRWARGRETSAWATVGAQKQKLNWRIEDFMEGRDQKGQQQSLCDFPGLSCLSRVLTLTWPPWPWLLSKVRILATKQRSDKRTEVCWARGNPGAALVAKGCRRLNEEKQWKEWSGGKGKARVPEIPKLPECTWENYLPVFPIGFYPAASAYACFYRNRSTGFWGPEGPAEARGRRGGKPVARGWKDVASSSGSSLPPEHSHSEDHQPPSQHFSEPSPWEGPRERLGVQIQLPSQTSPLLCQGTGLSPEATSTRPTPFLDLIFITAPK